MTRLPLSTIFQVSRALHSLTRQKSRILFRLFDVPKARRALNHHTTQSPTATITGTLAVCIFYLMLRPTGSTQTLVVPQRPRGQELSGGNDSIWMFEVPWLWYIINEGIVSDHIMHEDPYIYKIMLISPPLLDHACTIVWKWLTAWSWNEERFESFINVAKHNLCISAQLDIWTGIPGELTSCSLQNDDSRVISAIVDHDAAATTMIAIVVREHVPRRPTINRRRR